MSKTKITFSIVLISLLWGQGSQASLNKKGGMGIDITAGVHYFFHFDFTRVTSTPPAILLGVGELAVWFKDTFAVNGFYGQGLTEGSYLFGGGFKFTFFSLKRKARRRQSAGNLLLIMVFDFSQVHFPAATPGYVFDQDYLVFRFGGSVRFGLFLGLFVDIQFQAAVVNSNLFFAPKGALGYEF